MEKYRIGIIICLVCACSVRYPACNAHALYCRLWPVWLYHIFPHYLINGRIFEKKRKVLNIKCAFCFSLQVLSEIFLILRVIQRDMIKNVVVFMWSSPYTCQIFNDSWTCSTDVRKIFKCKISWKSSKQQPSFSMWTNGQMDIPDKANSHLSQFFGRA